jgi:DNA-binding MarR family transcriptional regulator
MAESKPGMHQLFLREEELREGLALMFQAWRDLNRAADAALDARDLGRAHHRAIYFIGRHPGLTVGALMGLLGITKQSLHRVLGDLVARALVVHRPGPVDRRERRLELTEAGRALERELTEAQRALIAAAYRNAGAAAVEGFRRVLLGLIEAPAAGAVTPPRRRPHGQA